MKKIYITPSVELIELKKVDIITASSPLDNTDWTNGDNALESSLKKSQTIFAWDFFVFKTLLIINGI